MRTAVFLQVRLSSTRLPGKALLPLAGKPVIVHAMEGLRRVPAIVHALLTDERSAKELEPIARRHGFTVFTGDPDDVLSRFAAAVRRWRIDRYFRATGDNPLVSGLLAIELEKRHLAVRADFSGFLGPPLGTGVELVEAEAICTADRESVDLYEREHASPFIYRRPERFRVIRPWAPDEVLMPTARVTLDTRKDLELLERIYDELYHGDPIEAVELVGWLRNHFESRMHETERSVHTRRTAG